MNLAPKTSILIADDHELFRVGFKHILQSIVPEEMEILADAKNGQELLRLVDLHMPDVVITDIAMPVINGIQACQLIKKKYPSMAVIAFSMFTDSNNILNMLQAGADGYLVKTSEKEEIIEAIRTVRRHKPYYCSTISQKLFGILANSNHSVQKSKTVIFGVQEINVILLICRQLSSKQIAAAMNLSVKTVEHYRQNIQEKIGAKNVVGVALYAFFHEIVEYRDLSIAGTPLD